MIDITEINAAPYIGPHGMIGRASFVVSGCFAVRDVRIIVINGRRTIAFPSRAITDQCKCGFRNNLAVRYCGSCGQILAENRIASVGGRPELQPDGRPRRFIDVAYPINNDAREYITRLILDVFDAAVERNGLPAA